MLVLTKAVVTPGVIKFTRLYVDSEGLTHIQDCTVQNMEKKPLPGGKSNQYVRNITSDIQPSSIILTQQIGNNPWHQCPTSQFVVTIDGTWFINSRYLSTQNLSKRALFIHSPNTATSGDYVEMSHGHVLYQDDYKGLVLPNGVRPVHFSGVVGDEPCNQMVISTASKKVSIDDKSCDWTQNFGV